MQEVHMGDEVPDKPPGSCRFLHSSLTTLRGGAGLSLEELAMPDLDLIKQGEQGLRDRRRRCSRPGPASAVGTGWLEDPATCGCPVYDGPAAPAPGLQRDLLFSSSPGAGCTSHLNVPEH